MPDIAAYLEMLREAAYTLSDAHQEPTLIQVLLAQAVSALEACAVLVRLLSPDGDELLLAGALGMSETYLDKGPVGVAESQVDQRVLAGEVVAIPDVPREPGGRYPEAAAVEGLHGMVAIPLPVRDQIIGLLRIYVDDVERLRPDDILVVSMLADLGALALEKARLHESLYRVAKALNSSLKLQPILQRVLEATVKEMWLKAASIRLLDSKRQVLRLAEAYGLSETYLGKGGVHVAKSPVDQRALQGEVVVPYDAGHETGLEYPAEAEEEEIRSVLVVPLKLKDRILGVMRVYSARPRHFGPLAIGFLTSVAIWRPWPLRTPSCMQLSRLVMRT